VFLVVSLDLTLNSAVDSGGSLLYMYPCGSLISVWCLLGAYLCVMFKVLVVVLNISARICEREVVS